ncbi:hypothetical protein THER5_1906 [Bifidobacterium thermacidophilum subsp. thermacidophilum]|uniref:Uncharacterized protein n=1 Tax=Bifidobacterium thermacidophilum subsp. thermacidophilum TaxID=79262 RepID=A0A087E2I7_9BIFI|nr:hypothetical protein THER5_1906 [Bifidobacterium thermacidophilum subsp. thermacidophilum]
MSRREIFRTISQYLATEGQIREFFRLQSEYLAKSEGAAVAGVPGCLHLHGQCENASGRAPVSPRNKGNRHPAGTSHASHALRLCETAQPHALAQSALPATELTFKIRHRRRATRTCGGQAARGVTSLS